MEKRKQTKQEILLMGAAKMRDTMKSKEGIITKKWNMEVRMRCIEDNFAN